MKLIFYRHGKTAGNLEGRYNGRTDEPLCPEGISTLRAKTDDTVRRVYVSTLRRTAQTAAILFPSAELVPCPGFSEMDFGLFEGKNYKDLQNDERYRDWVNSGCEARCPDGEDRSGFMKRVCLAFERVIEEGLANREEKLVFVVHGGTIMAIFSRYASPPRPYFDWQVKNGGSLSACLNEEEWKTKKTFHLAENEKEGDKE